MSDVIDFHEHLFKQHQRIDARLSALSAIKRSIDDLEHHRETPGVPNAIKVLFALGNQLTHMPDTEVKR